MRAGSVAHVELPNPSALRSSLAAHVVGEQDRIGDLPHRLAPLPALALHRAVRFILGAAERSPPICTPAETIDSEDALAIAS